MRWGNRLPRDMLDNGEEDGNLMIHKRTRNLVKSGIWHKFTPAQVLHNKLNAAPLQSTKLPHQPPFSFGRQERGPPLSSTSTHSSTSTWKEGDRFGTSCFGVRSCDGVETRSRQCFASGVIIIDGIRVCLSMAH